MATKNYLTPISGRSSAPRGLRSLNRTAAHPRHVPTNPTARHNTHYPSRSSPALDIQLVTQVSLDRWPRFAQQALAWGGPVSVAVYLPCPADHPLAPAYRHHLRNLVERFHADVAAADTFSTATAAPVNTTSKRALSADNRGVTNNCCAATAAMPVEVSAIATTTQSPSQGLLTITVVHATHMAREGANVVLPANSTTPSPSAQPSYDELYPINALRNAALAAATCSHVFLVDGDFLPSSGLRGALLQRPPGPQQQQQPHTGTLRTAGGACCGDHCRTSGVGRESEESASLGAGSDDKATHMRGNSTRSGCDECYDPSPEGPCSLLELSDRHNRPVMWVVPAFVMRRQDGSETATDRSPHGADTRTGGTRSPYDGGSDSDLRSQPRDNAAASASATDPWVPPLIEPTATGRPQCSQLLPEPELQQETAAVTVMPRRLEELVSYRLVDVHCHSARHVGRGHEQKEDVAGGSGAAHGDAAGGGKAVLRPFHCGRYPQRVPSIDFGQWWAAAVSAVTDAGRIQAEPTDPWVTSAECCERLPQRPLEAGGTGAAMRSVIRVERPQSLQQTIETGKSDMEWREVLYQEYFEPYGIVRRDQVPPYDERFRGYGLNKVQHAYHMAAAGFEFRLLSRHFCVTQPHARSPSYTAVFGSASDPLQRQRVEALYDTFKQEIYEDYGYRYAPP